MARTVQQLGFIDGKSSIWLVQSCLRMRVGIPGVFRIISSKSRRVMDSA